MMRNYEMTFRGVKLHSWIVASMAVILSACADNTDIFRPANSQTGPGLTFTIDESNEWFSTDTRSGEETLPSPFDPIVAQISDNEDQPLYLHTYALPTGTLSDISDRQNKSTRGAMVSSIDDSDKIGLIAYQCDNNGTPDFSNPIRTYLEKSGGNWVAADGRLQWKNSSQYEFYAYYPYASGKDITVTVAEGTAPTITYTNTGNVADDRDLLVARISASETDYKESAIPLAFTHPLATVVFRASPSAFQECKITSFEFGNGQNPGLFGSSASFSYEYDGVHPIWTPKEDVEKCNFSLSLGDNGFDMPENTKDQVGGETQTLMIVPTDENKGVLPKLNLSLKLKNGTTYGTPDGGISVSSFPIKAGYTTTFLISNTSEVEISDPVLESEQSVMVDYLEHSESFSIKSSVKVNGIEIPVSWKAELVLDENDKPEKKDSLIITTPAGGGNSISSKLNINILAQTAIQDDQHAQLLYAKPVKGSNGNRHDLSMELGSGRTSANCYIVSSAGYYKLPIVYGNSIKNGQNNESCGIGKFNFIDYNGQEIKHNDGEIGTKITITENTKAVLLWHDASLLTPSSNPDGSMGLQYSGTQEAAIIQNLKIERNEDQDYDYLTFDVPKELGVIQQANAVIGIADEEDKIMWSWHIWFTDFDPQNETLICKDSSIDNPTEFQVFLYPLGYCSGPGTKYYMERRFKIQLTQDRPNGISKTMEIIQQYHEVAAKNNVVLYQGRRKDPFVATAQMDIFDSRVYEETSVGQDKTGAEISEGVKKCYGDLDENGQLKYRFIKCNEQVETIKEAILHPNIFYYNFDQKGNSGKIEYEDRSWFIIADYVKSVDSKGNEKTAKNLMGDLWDSSKTPEYKNETSLDESKKTIYDPCPPGFMVPPSDFWKIWVGNDKKLSINNIDEMKANGGIWLWCYGINKDKTEPVTNGGQFFLSANGRRNAGDIDRVSRYCQYWESGCNDDGGRRFYIDSSQGKQAGIGSSAGSSVLPVKESD